MRPVNAPRIAERALTISAEIEPAGPNGVIVAQGGTGNGYTLFLQEGKLAFGMRSAKNLTVVSASEPLSNGAHKVQAQLAKDGAITLSVDGKTVAEGHAPGLIASQPARGLFVGKDAAPVAEYAAPNEFNGKIEKVSLSFP